MKKTDLAYFAGIMDGEGAIGICKHKAQWCKKGYRFELNVQVTSLDEWLLQSLKMGFGGYIGRSKSGFTGNPSWHWMIRSKQALLFLKALYPFLKLKRYQAEIAIKFGEAKKYGRQTDERMAIEEIQRMLIHKQTRKGIRLDVSNL